VDYVIGLGANLGSRRASLEAAIALLPGAAARVARVSRLYESEPIGPPQPRYYNAAVRVQCELAPHDLLGRLLEIERLLGRTREPAGRWRARTLDLDILWAKTALSSAALSIPHARLRERWFALAPLLDVAPELAGEFGPALAALGGARAPLGEELGCLRGELLPAGGARRAVAVAAAAEDALADAIGALGRGLWPGCGSSEVQVVGGAAEGAPLAAFARAALEHAAAGFAFARATLCEVSAERFEGRLLGARGLRAAAALPALRAVADEPSEGGRKLAIELAP
jgi:2-amino-4-hydroxy-6-hydroxymethyldihydropteridine diphosphokinase